MKIEIQLDEKGFCEEFKINDKIYGKGVERVKIDIAHQTEIDMYISEENFDDKKIIEENNIVGKKRLINFYSRTYSKK